MHWHCSQRDGEITLRRNHTITCICYSRQVLRFVDIQVVGFVVSLADVAQSRGVLHQQAVDGVNPEPTTVVILLDDGFKLVLYCMNH